ncbi:hypothetical protein BJV82DRAFT_519135 [Fennellomyces sp. T-0311]|nr:hypothetical protein BJV82DRAFT_519135 [Fennellomyces sp. T-0311]
MVKFGEKDAPLWQGVLDRHNTASFHVLLGGVDQLYQDKLIKEEFIKPWMGKNDSKKSLGMTLSTEM